MARNRRAQRLIRLQLLLQANGRLTARQLATRLDVSARTIQRDVEALVEAGIPIVANRGAIGGYRLPSGYRTRLGALSKEEAAVLLAGPPEAAELGFGTIVASAQLKVLATLPPDLREDAARAARLFHVDVPGWFRSRENVPYLAAVAGALWQERRIDVRYRSGGRVVRRVLGPLGLVLKGGAWYLVAQSSRGIRVHRLARVERIAVRDDPVRRPDGFDLAAFWKTWLLEFEDSRPRFDVQVRVRRSALLELRTVVGPPARRALDRVPASCDDEWVDVTIPFERQNVAFRDLLGFGDHIEVISPPELRSRMASAARALVVRYRADRAPDRTAVAHAAVPLDARLRWLIRSSPDVMEILRTVRDVDPPDWVVGAGIIRDLVWDHAHGSGAELQVKDVDVAFFDPFDLTADREVEIEGRLQHRLDAPWDAKNQARVHLWYERRFGLPAEPLLSLPGQTH